MFREILKEFIVLNDITQEELAEIMGVTQQAIGGILTSKSKPRKATKDKFFLRLKGFKDFFNDYSKNTRKKQDKDLGIAANTSFSEESKATKGKLSNFSTLEISEYIANNENLFLEDKTFLLVVKALYYDAEVAKLENKIQELEKKLKG